MTCGQCGSIDIVRYRSSAVDRIVRFFTKRKRVICRRCGWSARIQWDHDDHYVPEMAALRAMPVPEERDSNSRTAKFEEEFDINRFH